MIKKIRDYFQIMKPRVMWLNAFTAYVGMVAARDAFIYPVDFINLLAIFIGAGAAGAFNMAIEHETDALMERTKNRPVARKDITPKNAIIFAFILSFISLGMILYWGNFISFLLLGFTIFFYAVIYTIFLKPNTPENIVIGGMAGSMPPLIGWMSTGANLTIIPIALFLIIFVWTPPHFWALCLHNDKDYEKAKFPMATIIWGVESTKIRIVIYSVILVLLTFFFGIFTIFSKFFNLWAVIGGFIFLYLAIKLQKEEDNKSAFRLFSFSIIYLFLLFLSIIFDFL